MAHFKLKEPLPLYSLVVAVLRLVETSISCLVYVDFVEMHSTE